MCLEFPWLLTHWRRIFFLFLFQLFQPTTAHILTMTSLENGPFISTPKPPCICSCFRFTSKLTTKYPAIRQPPYSKVLIPIVALTIIAGLYYLGKGYLRTLLSWIEVQNPWLIFISFIFLFTLVSFPPPFPIGYLVLIITSGYLFGFVKGLLIVVLGANLGAGIAHVTIKSLQSKLPLQKWVKWSHRNSMNYLNDQNDFCRLLKNETGRAILRVIAGPRAFKIILLARLTPIPFGLQNTIFGVSWSKGVPYWPLFGFGVTIIWCWSKKPFK